MPDLTLLRQEFEQNFTRREDLRKAHPGKTMPETAREEFTTLTERSKALIDLIEVEKQRADDADLERQKAYLNEPVHHVPVNFNSDGAERKTLDKIGWELKGGMWHAPLASGQKFPMYSDETLFGPLPDDTSAKDYVQQTRRVIQPDYRDAWLKWYRHASLGPQLALMQLSGAEQKALSEGADTAGGFLVPPDIAAEVGGRRAQVSVMRRLASVRNTIRDQWQQPMVAPNTASGGRNIYTDDFVGAWVGETPSQSSIDVAYDMFKISIKKVRAYTLVSNDLIADSVGNLVSDLSQRGGKNLGLVEDNGFITGGANALEPEGILRHSLALTLTSSNGMAVDTEGTTANTISNSTSDPGSAKLIKQLVYKLPSQYAANASWLMTRTIQGSIAGLIDGNGRPFWNSYLESGFARPQMLIEGFPVENSEFMGADGSVSAGPSTIPLLFGDFNEYVIVERMGLSVRVLTERFGDSDQTGIFLFERVGGGLWNYDAFRTGVIYS